MPVLSVFDAHSIFAQGHVHPIPPSDVIQDEFQSNSLCIPYFFHLSCIVITSLSIDFIVLIIFGDLFKLQSSPLLNILNYF
jgi:hypothetical protein